MYLRFQTKIPDRHSGKPTGILVAAADLRDSGSLDIRDENWLRNHLEFYNDKLPVPPCLAESRNYRALSWFKPKSKFISEIWSLVSFMEETDVFIDVLRTDKPRNIIYEDDDQIIAIPNRDLNF